MPRLTSAQAPLTREVTALNERGEIEALSIPAERALTVYVDKTELVTIMTLGAAPELLVLGWLRNQRLAMDVAEVESITVDWDCGEHGEGAAAVATRSGLMQLNEKTAKKTVTTGCGQGSVYGGLMDNIDAVTLSPDARISQAQLYGLLNAIRLKETTYKSAGSVHGCALFDGPELLYFVEDVGRHNAIDTIAGWMWLNGINGSDKTFYTTGRLTSEMVMKAAQMGIAIVVSRSGITQMGHEIAERLGVCTVGRAMNRRFLAYTGLQRLTLDASLADARA